MLGILLTTLIFIGVLVGSSFLTNINEVKNNWQTYRCRPDVMLMAPIYGQDAQQNLEFCLKHGFDQRANSATSPFYTYLASFTGVLTVLLSSINSIRMTFATIIGTATTVFSEFSQRIQALFYRIQLTAIKIKYLMSRVFAAFYAVIFMATGGIKAGGNFSRTFLFKFIDFFCFEPETLILLENNKSIMIRDVRIGDVLEGGDVVTATFQFYADGQEMVWLDNEKPIVVSTNHYLIHKDKWIQAKDHPDAILIGGWNGGRERPLICLNTNTHSFRIGKYIFKDYDETSEGDAESMAQVIALLNNNNNPSYTSDSTMACGPDTLIKCPAFSKKACEISLGDTISQGTVVGIVNKLTWQVCHYKGEVFAPGTTIWENETQTWQRAGGLVIPVKLDEPLTFISFVVTPSASIETATGIVFRDYVEIHSPDLEAPYAKALKQESL